MGLKDLFGGKNRAAEQERLLEEQRQQEHQRQVEQQKKAHEGETWPQIPRLNILNIKDTKLEVEDSITPQRKDEIGQLVFEPDLSADQITGFTVQEMLFLQLTMTVFNRKAALTNYEKNHRVVYNEFLSRIHKAEKFYVLYDKRTGYPLIDGGFVPIYLEKERAEKGAELYKAQFRDVLVMERDGEAAPLKENGARPIAFFDYLYYIGVENVVVDNGWYKGVVKRSEISAPMDWNSDPKKTPPSNPALAFAMTDYVSENRWPVKYEKRVEILQKKTDRMMLLIPKGRYIVPSRVVDVDPAAAPEVGPDGQKPTKQVQFPAVKVAEKMYLPLFTDLFEYTKKFGKTDMKPVGFEYRNLLRFVTGGIEGIIINPNGQGIVISGEKARNLMLREAGLKVTPELPKEVKEQIAREAAKRAAQKQAEAAENKEDDAQHQPEAAQDPAAENGTPAPAADAKEEAPETDKA